MSANVFNRVLERWRRASERRRLGVRYRDVGCFCLFIGYPRSGHSLIGSLLSAHPEMVVAHELDALGHVAAGVGRTDLFDRLLAHDQAFHGQGRNWNGYHYAVPGQWQGRVRRLRVIGDKKGGMTAYHLSRDARLYDLLAQRVELPLRWIHVIRNPLDMIATRARALNVPLATAAAEHFKSWQVIDWFRARLRGTGGWFDLHLEDFVADPSGKLAALCAFLGVEAAPGYLSDCASIVFSRARQTRQSQIWSPRLRSSILEQAARRSYFRVQPTAVS